MQGGQGGSTTHHDAGVDASKDAAMLPHDAFSEFVDPGCPDAAKMVDYECDPMAPNNGGCAFGRACFPFVEYPMAQCGTETYGARCSPAGTGHQGDPCDQGCAGGYVCVVSGQGTQCVALCDLSAPLACKDGLICEPLDIPGVGGCL